MAKERKSFAEVFCHKVYDITLPTGINSRGKEQEEDQFIIAQDFFDIMIELKIRLNEEQK